MGHNVLEAENIQEELKYKRQWISLVTFLAAVLVMILAAVTVGVFGYAFCYVENPSGKKGNITKSVTFQIIHMPIATSQSTDETSVNVSSNFTILSSVIVSRLFDIGQLLYDDLGNLMSKNMVQSRVIETVGSGYI